MSDYCYVLCKNKKRCKNKSVEEFYYMNKSNLVCRFHLTYFKKNKSLMLIYNKLKIIDLPNEILYKIINYLDKETARILINLRITCKKFFILITEYIYKITKDTYDNSLVDTSINIHKCNNEFDYKEICKLIEEIINKKISIKKKNGKNNIFKLIEYVDILCNYRYILYVKKINSIIRIFKLDILRNKNIKNSTFTDFLEIEPNNIIFSVMYIFDNRSHNLILKRNSNKDFKKLKKTNIMEYNLVSSLSIKVLKCNLYMIQKALYIRDGIEISINNYFLQLESSLKI